MDLVIYSSKLVTLPFRKDWESIGNRFKWFRDTF